VLKDHETLEGQGIKTGDTLFLVTCHDPSAAPVTAVAASSVNDLSM
jgi:hypothetical protein